MLGFALVVLLGLGSLTLTGLGTAAVLIRWGGWSDLAALAGIAGFASAPVLVGLMAWPLLKAGLSGPFLAAAPGLAGAVILMATGLQRSWQNWFSPLRGAPSWLLATLALLAAAAVVQAITIAITESDALDYIIAGRIIARDGDLSAYPFTLPDLETGFYAPSIHPPSFHLLNAWIIQSAPGSAMLVLRLACVGALLLTALLVAHLAAERSKTGPAMAALLVFSTPMLVQMTTSFNSDAIRIAACVAALAAVVVALRSGGIAAIVAAACLSAVAMWGHSTGLIAPVVGLTVLLMSDRSVAGLYRILVFVALTSIVGGGWYIANLMRFGDAITDSWPAAEWPTLSYTADMLARRGLDTCRGLFLNGALQAFTEPALMGLSFWLAAWTLVTRVTGWANKAERVAIVAVCGFLTAGLIAAILGRETIIKNMRYVMTVVPMAALLGSMALGKMADRAGRSGALAAIIAIGMAGWVLSTMALRSYGLSSIAPLAGTPESWAISQERFPGGVLLRKMEAEMPGRVLTFRQPDMAHLTGRAWIDHYDPRLAGLHGISASDAAAAISALGARFAYVPSQTPVTITRSALGLMLADPKLARPLAEHRGARLFALTPESSTARCEAIERFSISTVNRTQGMMDWLAGLLRLPQLARRSSQEVYSGPRALPIEMGAEGAGPAELRLVPTDQISGRFVASVTLAGSTIVELSVDFEDGSGNRRRQPLLNGLGPPLPSTLQAQAVTLPGERLAAIIVQRTPGHGEALVVQRATLCQVVE